MRLAVSFGLLILIVVCLGLVGLKHVRADAEVEEIIDARWHKVQLSRNALTSSNLNNRITTQVFLIADENEINSLLRQRAKNSAEISAFIVTLRSRVDSSEEAQLLDAVEENRTPYLESYQRAMHLLVVDKKPVEARAVMVQEVLPRLLRYHSAWNAYVDYQGGQLDQAQNAASANHFTTRIEAFSLISLAIFLAIAIAFFVTRNLTRHMARRKLAEEALRQAHAELEMKVRERTSELAATNEELQEEIGARTLIEDEWRAAEDRYRQIVNSAKDMIYRLTPAGHFTFVNPAAAASVKSSVEECVGLNFLSLIRKDFRENAIQFYQQQVREKIPVTYFEFPVIAKDETEIWVGQNVQLEIEDGEVVELQAVGRDITSRKQMEEQLLESERHYRLLFESNPLPLWVYDLKTLAFLAVNNEAIDQYGYSHEEFLAMTISDIRPPEDVPSLLNTVAKLSAGSDNNGKWRHRKRDGSVIDVEITSHTLRFAGRPARIVLAVDITERKQAREALEVRAHQQAVVAEIGQLALAVTELPTLMDKVVALVAQGLDADYCKILELLPGDDELLLRAGVGWKEGLVGKATVSTGVDSQAGFTLLSNEAVVVEDLRSETRFQGPPLLREHGVVSGMSVIIQGLERPFGVLGVHTKRKRIFTQDDTHFLQAATNVLTEAIEHKRSEQALRESEEKYRTILENIEDGYYEVDIAGNFTFFNDAMCKILRYSRDELMGMNNREYSDEENSRKVYETFSRVHRTGEPARGFDWQIIRKDSGMRFVEASVSLIKDSSGSPTGFRGIVHDVTERKRAEEELKESQQWLAAIYDSSRDGIIVEESEHIVYVNQSYAYLFGYEPGELIGQPVWLVSEQAPSQRMLEYSWRRMRGEEAPSLYEFRGTRKDGRTVDLEASVSTAKIAAKTYIIALCRDITERKRAEEEILLQKARFQQLFENAPLGILRVDQNDIVLDANKEFEAIFQFSLSEICGRPINEIVVPKGHREEGTALSARALQGEIIDQETVRQRKDGTLIPVQIYGVPIVVNQKPVGVFAIYADLTEQKRLEDERQVVSEIIQGVITTANLDELYRLIHRSISKVLYAENCFVALHDPKTDLMHFEFWVDKLDPCPPPLPLGIGFGSYVLRTGQSLLLDRELTERMYQSGEVEKSGSSSASWLGVPLRTASRSIGVLVVQHYEDEDAYGERDLEFLSSVGNQIALAIERKRAETNLRETEEQLRQSQKMESIGTLAGGIAHDFNNLMTAVTGYSELALRSLEVDNPVRPKIEEIKKAGERAAALTRQLLAFSRKQILQPRVLDLNTVITGMSSMLPRVIGEDIDLRMDPGDLLGQVKADPGQIEQVLLNLAVNARDAMPKGGYLTIKTENVYFDAKFSQRRSVVEPGQYVALSVSDSGCGMDAETQAHIFEPFFTTKEVGKGTGLGLSTVYGIVKQSGGSIWVYSEVGRGTAFKIYLPRVDEVVETEELGDKSSLVQRGHETILLVEDEDVVRDLSKEILEEYGFAVITAPNGKEGLRICKEFEGQIDLMITDVVMPQMGGRELAEKLGAVRPDTRVLYMSGFTDDAVVRHGVLDDGICFIQKPFSPDSLVLRAREVLDQNGSR
jgi:PAS domain S-box-containing protein